MAELRTILNKQQRRSTKQSATCVLWHLTANGIPNLFKEIRATGAQLELMGDGDVSGAIWAARPDGPFDLLMGIGAAPEGVISATAIRGLGGVFEGRLVFRSEHEEARAEKMVGDDLTRLWEAHDLCKSDDAIFAASGVCDGYLPGVLLGDTTTTTFSEVIDVAIGDSPPN